MAYVFLHEVGFGEIVRDKARQIDDWIGCNYGPRNGLRRFYLPTMPILTVSPKISIFETTMPVIDLSIKMTGYSAFCIPNNVAAI